MNLKDDDLISLNSEQVNIVFKLADHIDDGLRYKLGLIYWGFNILDKTATFKVANAKLFLLAKIKYGL